METPTAFCGFWSLAPGLAHKQILFKLESVERTNAGLPSSGSAFHGAAGAQVSSQSERTWPYIREHHILGNASRANSLSQSYPEQGVKQPEVYFATTKTSIISLPEPAVITNPSPFHQHLVGCCDQGRRGAWAWRGIGKTEKYEQTLTIDLGQKGLWAQGDGGGVIPVGQPREFMPDAGSLAWRHLLSSIISLFLLFHLLLPVIVMKVV